MEIHHHVLPCNGINIVISPTVGPRAAIYGDTTLLCRLLFMLWPFGNKMLGWLSAETVPKPTLQILHKLTTLQPHPTLRMDVMSLRLFVKQDVVECWRACIIQGRIHVWSESAPAPPPLTDKLCKFNLF